MAILWITKDHCSITAGRSGGQPQSHPTAHARDGYRRDLPRSESEQAYAKGRHLSLSFASYHQSISQSYLGAGYHVHSLERRLDVPSGRARLVLTICSELGIGPDAGIALCLDCT